MRSRRKLKLLVGVIVAILGFTIFGITLYSIENHMNDDSDAEMAERRTIVPSVLLVDLADGNIYTNDHDVESILFIGTDSSGDVVEEKGYFGNLADFMLLAVVDHTDKSYGFIQLNRDLYTEVLLPMEEDEIPVSTMQQLCLAHYYGKDEMESGRNTVGSVRGLLKGLPIEGFYSIHMDDLPMINQALGGVTITLPSDATDIDPAFTAGATVTLTDAQAASFIRARMGVGEGTNAERMERQLLYMNAAMEQMKQATKEDASFPETMLESFDEVSTSDLKNSYIANLASKMLQYTSKGVLRIDGESTLKVSETDQKEHECLIPSDESVMQVITTLCGDVTADDGQVDEDMISLWSEGMSLEYQTYSKEDYIDDEEESEGE